jgi:hypothetical protein
MGKKKDKKKTCHLALVLEQLLRYKFQDNFFVVTEKKIIETQIKPKRTKKQLQHVWMLGEEE